MRWGHVRNINISSILVGGGVSVIFTDKLSPKNKIKGQKFKNELVFSIAQK
jgi:hypothetical protein